MSAIALLTALYIGAWFGVYSDEIKKELTPKPPIEQTQKAEQKK